MGIQALPQATVRILGASQVLTDPAAVVKELVDNALDAQATSISIEIHNNTLGLIQVRDNGHGIPPGDRHLVARPHCTSKISSEADLEHVAGSSLGFRGEALASVAEMSGSLNISTRVEGEQVATSLRINQQGEVIGQQRASTPVGTTIKITDFIKANPVRRQIALKSIEQTMKKIRQILQAYALARPQVRLSLRVLKAKNDQGNWMYAPKPGGNAEDAAFKVIGAACASQCVWSVVEDRGFTVSAFLPRKDADKTKVSKIGPFVSVDGRPLFSSRGIMKQVVKAMKLAMQTAGCNLQDGKDLFLLLNIRCESASYDANIEPAKDDILFEDPDAVLSVTKTLFGAVYPPQPTKPSLQHPERSHDLQADAHSIDDSSSKTPVEDLTHGARASPDLPADPSGLRPNAVPTQPTEDTLTHSFQSTARNEGLSNFRSNMYGCDEEDLDLTDVRPPDRTEGEMEEQRQIRKDVRLSNPWIMAKLNSSRRLPTIESDFEVQRPSVPRIYLDADIYPTPQASSPTPPLPQNPQLSGALPNDISADRGEVIAPRAPRCPLQHPQLGLGHGAENGTRSVSSSIHTSAYDYTLSSQSEPAGSPLSAIPVAGQRSPQKRLQQGRINMSFKPPLQQQPERERVWFDHLENLEQRQTSPRKKQYASTAGLVTQGELGDLVDDPRSLTPPRRNRDMRDFVTSLEPQLHGRNAPYMGRRDCPSASVPRDEDPISTFKVANSREIHTTLPEVLGFVSASELAAMQAHVDNQKANFHHSAKRRRRSDDGALQEISANVPVIGETDTPDQSGARDQPTPRRRKTADGSKLSRRKSSRLPLERTPAGQGTHALVLKIETSETAVRKCATKGIASTSLLQWHEPSTDAYDTFATIAEPDVIGRIAGTLEEMLVKRVSDGEMVRDMSQLVQDALAERHDGHNICLEDLL